CQFGDLVQAGVHRVEARQKFILHRDAPSLLIVVLAHYSLNGLSRKDRPSPVSNGYATLAAWCTRNANRKQRSGCAFRKLPASGASTWPCWHDGPTSA